MNILTPFLVLFLGQNVKTGERKIEVESEGTNRATDPSSLANLTKNLSLNGSPLKSNSLKSPLPNSISSVSAASAF